MSDFGSEIPEFGTVKPILTQLTENLYEAFEGVPPEEFKPAHVLMWMRGLDPSDSVNAYVLGWMKQNPGWLKLLAGRVRRHLEAAPSA